MQAKPTFKIFFLFISLCAFVSATVAQEKKPQTVLFDEISDTEAEYSAAFDEKMQKLKKALAKEPDTTKAYIDEPQNSALSEKLKLSVEKDAAFAKRVMFWGKLKHPDLRPRSTNLGTLIYLIPQGAEIPARCILEPCVCPNLDIIAPATISNRNSAINFTAKVAGGDIQGFLSYKWTVAAGKIVEGQGTPTIKVDAEDAKEIIITLEINGVCDECPREAMFTTKIQQ